MLLNSEEEMQIACEQWLQAREQFMRGSGAELLAEYGDASERLFAAFISDFRNEDFAVMANAFKSFRGCLVKSCDTRHAYPAWPEKNVQATT